MLFRFSATGLSNVTFRPGSGILHYRSNGKITRSLTSVSLSFRSRQSAATLLHAHKDSKFLTLSLLNSRLVMELQVGDDKYKMSIQSRSQVSDGEWHRVELSMETRASTSSWIVAVDGGKEGISLTKTAVRDLEFLSKEAEIFLGGLNQDTGVDLSGCLGPVEIGGLLLPFHLDTELNLPRPQEEQFVRINNDVSPHYGCWGAGVCTPNPCMNEGVCEDLFDLHRCACSSEWTGPSCRDLINPCTSGPCVYGNCINLTGEYKCVCEQGYGGEQCEVEVNMCDKNNCSHGATCLKGFHTYSCLCPQNLTGQYCE